MTNIILCGGNGTRLWPISRSLLPKQFVKLFDNRSLFQLTVQRNENICHNLIVVSNFDQYFLAFDQLEELKINNAKYFLEPIGRNTAPAIALSCFSLSYDEIVLVTPSDHLVKNYLEYEKVLKKAEKLALDNRLVTFGIVPTFAETGFGYIESQNEHEVKAFHEKPDVNTAIKYLNSGNFLWNSGIFMFKAGVFLDELKKYSPEIYETSKNAYLNSSKNISSQFPNLLRINHEDMAQIPEDSIDYAVMEKSKIVSVVKADINWSDLGSFDALDEEFTKDENQNTKDENLIAINSKNNFIYSSQRMITLADIDDLIVVDTPDALLISKKGSSQKIKEIVKELKGRETTLHNIHQTVHRPWGTYTVLEEKENYKIKKLVVNPQKRLSLQKHLHRNEHWIVVSGTATVTVEDKVMTLRENESTYIKMGEIHRLTNEGKLPAVIIEVQVGDYLEEDDIIRIDDDFNREIND